MSSVAITPTLTVRLDSTEGAQDIDVVGCSFAVVRPENGPATVGVRLDFPNGEKRIVPPKRVIQIRPCGTPAAEKP